VRIRRSLAPVVVHVHASEDADAQQHEPIERCDAVRGTEREHRPRLRCGNYGRGVRTHDELFEQGLVVKDGICADSPARMTTIRISKELYAKSVKTTIIDRRKNSYPS